MKRSIALTGLMLSQLSFAQLQVVPAPVKHLYVPEGFDSNDSVEVVVSGTFPNPCYSRNDVSVTVSDDKIDVQITALAREEKLNCPAMLVPFKEVVSVGNLQGGEYTINVNQKLSDKLVVQEANSGAVDDHIYADIDNVTKSAGGKYVLNGWRYSNCIVLDHVEVRSNHKDTLSVLPIMKQLTDFCPMKMMPVSYDVNLDFRDVKIDEALIHVRTMDGKSFNSLVDLKERR